MQFTITDSDGFASTQYGTHIDFIDDELLVIKDGQNIVSAHRDWTRVTSTEQMIIGSTMTATVQHLGSDDLKLQDMETEAMEAGVQLAKLHTVAIIHAEMRKLLDDGVNQLGWYDSHIRVLNQLDSTDLPPDIALRLDEIYIALQPKPAPAPAPQMPNWQHQLEQRPVEPPRMPEQPAEPQCEPMPEVEPQCNDCGAAISRCECSHSDAPAQVPQRDLGKKRTF